MSDFEAFMGLRLTGTSVPRFWSKVAQVPGGCWLWTASTRNGYGQFQLNGGMKYAHRIAFVNIRGPIPGGTELDHITCDTPRCVHPFHVNAVTHAVNVRRGRIRAAQLQTHCRNGHEFSPDNLYASSLAKGYRQCKTCTQARARRGAA